MEYALSWSTAVTTEPLPILAPDGLSLAAERYRGRSGRPGVVLAHGFGQTRQAWGATARRLAEAGHPCLCFDARGHGQSGWNPPATPYRHAQFVADLGAVAAACPQPRILVGASMGGLIGLMAQALEPRFSALVLVDITPRWQAEGVARIMAFMSAHPEGFADLAEAAEAIAAYLPHRPRKSREQLDSLLVPHCDGRLRWHWDPRLLEEIGRGSDYLQPLLVQAARSLAVPTLLVSGGRSDLVSAETVEEFLALAPHAEHIAIPHATHMVAGDDNDRFSAAVLDFLARQVFAGTAPGDFR